MIGQADVGALNAGDKIKGGAFEPLPDLDGSLVGGEGGDIETVIKIVDIVILLCNIYGDVILILIIFVLNCIKDYFST